MKQIIRKLPGARLVMLEFHYGSPPGSADFFTLRAYIHEDQPIIVEYQKEKLSCASIARCQIDGTFYRDLGQLDLKGNSLDKSHSDVYRLIDAGFPELIGKGLKAEGYAKLTVQEVKKALPGEIFS